MTDAELDALQKYLVNSGNTHGDCLSAAYAIEALRNERDKWKAAVFAADQHAADLVSDNAALRIALAEVRASVLRKKGKK